MLWFSTRVRCETLRLSLASDVWMGTVIMADGLSIFIPGIGAEIIGPTLLRKPG